MPPEKIQFGNHYSADSCKTYVDLGKPLDVLKTLGWFVLNHETPKNLRRYGLWSLRFHSIAQEGLRNIQEFIMQGGTQVEDPLVLSHPTNFDANNYPLGTYLRTYAEIHALFSPKLPNSAKEIFLRNSPDNRYRIQVMEMDYILAQNVGVGIVTQAPDPKKRFIVCSFGSDMQILQGNSYNSISEPFVIGRWFHIPVQGPKFLDLGGVRLDIFATTSKIEILQAGETETERAAVGRKIFVSN